MTEPPALVLASSSQYRRALLERLGLPFSSVSPDIDETPLPGEGPRATALRLAEAKARALRVATSAEPAVIIGSDQTAVMADRLIGKPGGHAAAVAQLHAMSGNEVTFHTALCLFNPASGTTQTAEIPTTVRFRQLDAAQIERYLAVDRPYDCAGSAKIEALGIALVEQIESSDPTALIGLPLIALVGMLRREGIILP